MVDKGKRKAEAKPPETSVEPKVKRSKTAKQGKAVKEVQWPEEFHQLFKIFKTLNTVLAFCSTRKNLATSFSVVRSSVEGLLKRPLDLGRVAELKALLPDLISFAYIPKSEHAINEASGSASGSKKTKSGEEDLYAGPSRVGDEEHVLVLDFRETKRKGPGKKEKEAMSVNGYGVPPALSPADVKKLILKRNERFEKAVNELLQAMPENEDPVQILRDAAKDHIPVNPAGIEKIVSTSSQERAKRSVIPSPNERPTIDAIIKELTEAENYGGQMTNRITFEARSGIAGELLTPLSPSIREALQASRNISGLYSHQAAAINSVLNNRHVVVSTSTASGKSVIYQVPLLRYLEADSESTAIFIYPTKALAQDQKVALQHLLHACSGLDHIKVSTYDGDTPREIREDIRESSSVIFTNFDMMHASILPHEDVWRKFLKNLKLVAVDELHYYSSVFGSHVAQVMRRFRRVCAALGNRRVRFISCSATIGDPLKHMQNIFGVEDIDVIDEDGAPSGRKDFITWNPPLIDAMDPSLGRDSALRQAVSLMGFLMARGVRTIMFCKIRKMCELAMKAMRAALTSDGRLDILEKVVAYRGGYSQEDRRRIEREAFGGNLLGIIATNALELGVDIGVLDAVIMLGFPYSIANLRQQSGRAGRRARDSLTVLVTDNNAIDQHYGQNAEALFSSRPEPLVIDLGSLVIMEAHLQCASQEMPLSVDDEKYFGPLFKSICDQKLLKDGQGWYHPHPRYLPYPSKHVFLRGVQEEKYIVLDVSRFGAANDGPGKILEEIEFSRALFETYEGGVFIHQGQTFLVREVNHDTRLAKVIQSDVNWTTKPRDFTDVDALQTHRIREVKGSPIQAFYGNVEIKCTVFGFFKLRGGVILDTVALDTPPFQRETTGWWIDIPQSTLDIMRMKALNMAEGIHAASHAILNQFDMQKDIKTECKLAIREYKAEPSSRKRPGRLMFYDGGGKGGVAANAFDHVSRLIHASQEAIESCTCDAGCNKCVFSAWCKEGNDVMSKLGAKVIIRGILDLPIDLDSIPDPVDGPETHIGTIIEATEVPQIDGITVEHYA